jgi:hypothetical protein
MPITVPAYSFTFAAESGNQPAAQLDTNFATIRNAMTGVALQASDLVDGYAVRGLSGGNNGVTPNTKYDLSANLVVLRAPGGGLNVQINAGVLTNDVGLSGPAAGGRDQSGAFSASSWIHFYFIWSGSTLSTVSSTVAPPTGPTLPGGYTHWAYCGAVRFDGSSHLIATHMSGSKVYYVARVSALSAGGATTETTVSLSALIPPNAVNFGAYLAFVNLANASANVQFRYITGFNYFQLRQTTTALNSGTNITMAEFPNVSQQMFYINSAAGDATDIDIMYYTVPNGGE